MPLRIVVDFDDTIVVSKYPFIGRTVPFAKYFLKKLRDQGHYVIIASCRTSSKEGEFAKSKKLGVKAMLDAVKSRNIPHDEVDMGDIGKVHGDVYIDDRAAGCPLRDWDGRKVVDWPKIYKMLMDEWVDD